MGKGDRKTAKGKRYVASYGNKRPHDAVKTNGAAKTAATPKAPVAKKTAVKKKA